MRSSAVSIRQTGATLANNILTLITFLVLNLIFIIPVAQFFLRPLNYALSRNTALRTPARYDGEFLYSSNTTTKKGLTPYSAVEV